MFADGAQAQAGASVTAALTIEPADVEMIDGVRVFMLLFYGASGARPVLRATEGDQLRVVVRNNDSRPHGFSVPGVPGASIPSIGAGQTREVIFTAPRGGTYLYLDPTLAPINRLLGLHGALIVAPLDPTTPAGVITPFSRAAQTSEVRAVFEALGPPGRFPGRPWSPDRDRIWMFSQIDPALHRRVDLRQSINPASVAATFAPRYFTLNGRSGFDAAHDEATAPEGYIGEPMLLRVLNAGLATHSPHIHGNHVMELSGIDAAGAMTVRANLLEIDAWTMSPLDRKDVLLPFERPPDIPAAAYPMREEQFPLHYPMHCHIEMSQTAGGGLYPHGLIADWTILGPTPPES
ncbi:MAG: hypothetical protein ABL883_01445 [Terricaulis sp.]